MAKVLSDVSEDDIKASSGAIVFERGLEYFEGGVVSNVMFISKNELSGRVRGSNLYRTSLILDDDGGLDCSCSCPYEGGFCKHSVALALYLINNGDKITRAIDIKAELLKKSKEELVELVINEAKKDTYLFNKLSKSSKVKPMKFQDYKDEAEQAFGDADFSYRDAYDIVQQLEDIFDDGKRLAKSGNIESAFECFEALICTIMDKDEEVDDEGEISTLADEIFEEIVITLNSSKLTDKEIKPRLEKWLDFALWGDNLGGSSLDDITSKVDVKYLGVLKEVAENMLEERKSAKGDEESDYGYEYGVIANFILDLDLREKNEDNFIRDAEEHFEYTYEKLIDHYIERKAHAKAVEAAERALLIAKGFYKTNLMKRLAIAQKGLGRGDEAFGNMLIAFLDNPGIEGYKELKKFANSRNWKGKKRDILNKLSRSGKTSLLCEIYAVDGDVDELKALLYRTDWDRRRIDDDYLTDSQQMLTTIERALEKKEPAGAAFALKLLALKYLDFRDRESYRASARSLKGAMDLLKKNNLDKELDNLKTFTLKLMKERWNYSALQEEFSNILGFDEQRKKN